MSLKRISSGYVARNPQGEQVTNVTPATALTVTPTTFVRDLFGDVSDGTLSGTPITGTLAVIKGISTIPAAQYTLATLALSLNDDAFNLSIQTSAARGATTLTIQSADATELALAKAGDFIEYRDTSSNSETNVIDTVNTTTRVITLRNPIGFDNASLSSVPAVEEAVVTPQFPEGDLRAEYRTAGTAITVASGGAEGFALMKNDRVTFTGTPAVSIDTDPQN